MSEVNYLELLRTVEQGLGTEVLNRAEGDLLAQAMVSKYLSDLVASNEADIQRYIEFRTKYGDDHDALAGTMETVRVRLAETCRLIDEDLKNFITTSDERYVSMQKDIKKYLRILSDITLDSTQITLDNGEIQFGAWTILSQARKWDLDLLKQLNKYVEDKTQEVNDSLNDFLNSVDTTEDIISKAIEELSNSPHIKELDALLNESILGLDGLKDSIYQEAIARAKEYEELARKMSEDAEKRKEEILTLVKANEDEILEATIASRDEMLERINSQVSDISDLADSIANESKARANELLSMSASLSEEYTKYNLARIEDIKKLNDGLTSESTLRKQGDDASMEVINTYKVSNDSALSSVRNSLATNVTAQEATAKKVDSLDTQYKTVNEALGTIKTTTASNTTEIKNVASANKALTERVDQILAQITDPGEGTEVTVNAFNALKAEVTTNTSSLSTLAEDTRALRSDYESLSLNVSGTLDIVDQLVIDQTATAESVKQVTESNTVLSNNLNTVKGDLATKVDTTLFNSLKAEVKADRDSLSSVVSDISTLQNQVSVATKDISGKASIESVSGVQSSVTALDGKLTVVVNDLAKTNTALDSKASLETVSGLQSKIEAQGNDITLLNGQVASYSTNLNEYKEANTKALTGLTADIKKLGEDVTSYSGQVTDLESTVSLLPNNGINLLSYNVSVMASELTPRLSSTGYTHLEGEGYLKGSSAIKAKVTSTSSSAYIAFGRDGNESTYSLSGTKLVSFYVKAGMEGIRVRISCFRSVDGSSWGSTAGDSVPVTIGTEWVRIHKYLDITDNGYLAPCLHLNMSSSAVSANNYVIISNVMVENATASNKNNDAPPSAWVIGTGSYSGFDESKLIASKAYQGLVTKTDVLEKGLETQANAQTSLSSELDKKATITALNSLTTRVTTAEAGIKTHTSDMTKLQTAIDGKASTDALRLVVANVDEIDGKLSTTSQIVDSLESSYISGIIRSGYDSASNIDNLFTRYSPQATIVDESDTGTARVLTLGTDSVAASQWIRSKDLIAFRPDKLYKLSARFRRVSGTGGVYLGVASMNYEETLYINTANATNSSLTASAYMYSNMKPTLGEWVELTYYIKGRSTGNASGAGTLQNPKKLASKSAKIAPLMITNYSGIAGVTEVDYFYIEQDDHSESIEADSQAITVLQNGTKEINDVLTTQATQLTNLNSRTTNLETDIKTRATITQLNEAKTGIDSSIASTTTTLTARMDGINTGSTNLFNRWALRTGYIAANTGGISSNGGNEPTATSTFVTDEAYYPCKAGQVYYVTKHEETTTPTGEWSRFAWYNSSKELISYVTPYYSNTKVGASTKMTAPTNAAFFRYTLLNPRDRVKLELGSATAWTANDEAAWAESNASRKGSVLADAIDLVKVDVVSNAEGIAANANKTTLLETKASGDNVTNLLKDPTFLNVANTWEGSLLNLFARKLPTEDLLAKASSAYPATIKAIDLTGTSLEYYGALIHELIPITPGRKYSISGGIRCIPEASSEGSVRISVDLADASGTIVKWQDLFTLSLDTTEAYTSFSESFTVEKGELFARVRCRLRYSKDGKLKASLIALPSLSLEVEPVSLNKAMAVLDSKYEDVAGTQKSQATQLTNLEANLDKQKIGGTNLLEGTQSGGFIKYGTTSASTVTETLETAFRTSVYRVDRLTASTAIGIITPSASRTATLKSGKEYTISFYARGTKDPNYVYTIKSSSTDANNKRNVSSKDSLSETDFVLFTGTFTADYDAINKVGILIGVNGGVVGDWLEVAEVMIQEGNTPTTWQDSYLDEVDLTDYAKAQYVNTVTATVKSDLQGEIKSVVDSVTVLTSKNDDNINALAVQAKVVDGIKAQYLVKMETNGVLAGFGLLQSNNTLGQVVSTFGVNADNFYIGAPANGKKPFIVTTKTTTLNGVSYPAGTWIDVAFIATATIGTAHIADASITNAKIKDINADKITAGTIDAARIRVGSSTTFDTGYNPATNLTTATNLANTKSKTFTSTPTVPYSIGDIWKDGVTIKIATVARASTATYTSGDWVLVGDITANGTSADTAKVNGVAASTVTSNASKGLAVYDDVMSDLKITPVEKTAINQEWKRIQAEYTTLISQANALSVSTTNYVSAYNGLGTTAPSMTTILSSLTTTTTLTSAQRDAYRTQYTNYYTQVSALTKAIDDKIAADAQAALDGLAIGGRNYVLDSSTVTKNKTLSPSWDFTALSGQDVTISFDIEVTTATTGTLTVGSAVRDRIGVEVGVTQASGGTLYFSAFCYEVLSKGVFKERVVKRIRLPELTTNPKTLNYLPQVTGGSFLVSNLKIELGTKATDWTPAAEDLAKTFMSTPTVPYSLGDMWRNGSALYVCTTAQTSSGTYNVSNWTLVGDVTANNTAADSLKLGGTLADTVIKNASTGSSMAADILSDLVVTPVEKTALYNEYNRIKAEYTNQLAQANALSVTTTSYTTAYNAIDGTAPKMSTILSSMTTSTTLTTTERNNFRTQLNTYYTQATAIAKSITTAVMAKAAADTAAVSKEVATALTTLDNIASDTIITPVEKKQVKTIWDSIRVGNTNLLAQATKAGVSSSAYTTAYNTLNTYVTSLLSNMATNSTVVRSTFNTNFSNVYTQIAALEKLINDAAFVGTEKVNSITSVVSNETVIEGGKIRTGTIAADKLSVTSLSAISANLGSISVGTANITNNAITNAKIADLSVNSAKIVDASITNAKIANLSVDSLKIRDQAVTVTVAGVGVSQLSINTDGGIVFIDIGIETNHLVSGGVSGSQYVRLYRNGSAIKTYSLPGTTLGEYLSWNICQTLATITDNPPKGSHVYSIKVTSSPSGGVTESNLHTPASKTWVPLSGVSMRLLEIKK